MTTGAAWDARYAADYRTQAERAAGRRGAVDIELHQLDFRRARQAADGKDGDFHGRVTDQVLPAGEPSARWPTEGDFDSSSLESSPPSSRRDAPIHLPPEGEGRRVQSALRRAVR